MHNIWTDASIVTVSSGASQQSVTAFIGFHFESQQGLVHSKCEQCKLDKSSSSVEAEIRAILLAWSEVHK
jgi:hypothetical protein